MSTTRTYVSRLRGERAADTRSRIQQAARDLFATNGFNKTTITEIGARAEVSTQTVYAVFGNKAAIIASMLTFAESEAGISDARAVIKEVTDPRVLLRMFVELSSGLFRNNRDMFRAVLEAPALPELEKISSQGNRARLDACIQISERMRQMGALSDSSSANEAAHTMWLLSSFETYLSSTLDLQRSHDEHVEWLFGTLEQLILRDEGPA